MYIVCCVHYVGIVSSNLCENKQEANIVAAPTIAGKFLTNCNLIPRDNYRNCEASSSGIIKLMLSLCQNWAL